MAGQPPLSKAATLSWRKKADGSRAHFYIMAQSLKLSGGLSSQLAAKGENETSANFSSAGDGPTDKKADEGLYLSAGNHSQSHQQDYRAERRLCGDQRK